MTNRFQALDEYQVVKKWSYGGLFFKRAIWLIIFSPIVASSLPGTLWRKSILRIFGAKIGTGGRIKPKLRVTLPWKLEVGNHCWLGEDIWIDNLEKVKVCNHVCISQGAYFCTGNHNYKSRKFDLMSNGIKIHSGAWIAAKAVLAPGSEIGSGAVVSLGAVVKGQVAAESIVSGNPAEFIGYRK